MISPALLAALVALTFLWASPASARCPYTALWAPNSPYKLPDDHPAMVAYVGSGGHGGGRRHGRALAQVEESNYKGKGSGTCTYMNPFSQQETCVQMTGEAYEVEDAAKLWCDAPGLPGAVGTYVKGGSCAQFDDENFGGVCVNGKGTPEETVSAFVEGGGPLGSCATTIMGCETFGGGEWVQAGGKCAKDEDDESMKSVVAGGGNATAGLAEGECKLQAGIAGGGHMDMEAFWTSSCANSNSSYSTPRRWTADTKTITTQKEGSVSVGKVWYDLENNRRREDSFRVEGAPSVFNDARNTTFIHMGPTFYLIDWNEDGTHKCTISPSPVGILRPNWIIDSLGYGAVSQYLGVVYQVYEGKYRRVKQFRKTEPLEDAYMVQSFDDEEVWETPEGPKRRPLERQTPGAPFQGDAVNQYFNHSTTFSDDVFEIYKSLDCKEREFNRTQILERQKELAEKTGVDLNETKLAQTGGLNLNSSLHVDSSVLQVDCENCDITYEVRATEEDGEEIGEEVVSGDVEEDGGAAGGADFEGQEEASSELAISWSYSGANSTLRVVAELDKDAWLSIAFPDIPCLMEPAVSVIALPQGDGSVKTNRYSINSHSAAGIKEMLGDDNGGIPSFVGSSTDDGKVKVELTKVVSSFPLSVTWARGFDRNLGYHGGSGRGCLEVSPPVQE